MNSKNKQNKIGILLTASGGLGIPSLIDCLRYNYEKKKIKIVCTDTSYQSIADLKADKFYTVPKGNSKNYLNYIIKICKKENIQIIMPGSALEINALSKNIKKLKNNNIIPTVSDYKVISKLSNKAKTYSFLQKNKIPVPDFFQVRNSNDFFKAVKLLDYPKKPICFKPSSHSQSGGARGFRILRRQNNLNKSILKSRPGSIEIDYLTAKRLVKESKNLNLLLMEYLPGIEYSVYVFAQNGIMKYCVPNIRRKLEQFYSKEAEISCNKKIIELSRKITELFKFDYNVNIQFKLSKTKHPKVVEINPRIGGEIILPTAAGLNLPYFAAKYALNEEFGNKSQVKKTKLFRYWREVFVSNGKTFNISDVSK